MTSEELTLTGSMFTSLSGRLWKPETASPRAVILMEHGIGEHIGIYEYWAELFCNKGFAFAGFDLRGHGRSSGKRGHTPGRSAIDDLNLIVNQIYTLFPDQPLFLYGHSLGANLLLYFMITYHPRVAGMIISSPTLHVDPPSHKNMLKYLGLLNALMPATTFKIGMHAADLTHQEEETVQETAISPENGIGQTLENVVPVKHGSTDPFLHQWMSIRTFRDMLQQARWILDASPKAYTAPVLIMHGMDDTLALPLGSIQLASQIGKQATLKLWKNAKHELHREKIAPEVFDYVLQWINRQIPESRNSIQPQVGTALNQSVKGDLINS